MYTTRFLRAATRLSHIHLPRPRLNPSPKLRLPPTTHSYTTKPPPPTEPPTPTPHQPPPRAATFYRTHSYPVLKAFLGALFTYQLAYYVWMKLEVEEEKVENRGRVEEVKGELRRAVGRAREG